MDSSLYFLLYIQGMYLFMLSNTHLFLKLSSISDVEKFIGILNQLTFNKKAHENSTRKIIRRRLL